MFAIFLLISFSCTKKESLEIKSGANSVSSSSKENNRPRVIFRFKWEGIIGGNPNPCLGGICGQCPGVCFKIEMRQGYDSILLPDSILGDGHATVELLNDTTLIINEMSRTCDNGSGTTNLTNDFFIGNAISDSLGCDSVIILRGIYPIIADGSAFGKVIFNVRTN